MAPGVVDGRSDRRRGRRRRRRHRWHGPARALPHRAHGLLLPDARQSLRGRRRRAGDPHPGLEGPRPLRGPLQPALVALPHRHQRLLRPPRGHEAPGPPDRPGPGQPLRPGHRRPAARVGVGAAGARRAGWCPRRPTPPSRPRSASPCGWRSSPPSSTCRPVSGRCSCCARSCASRPSEVAELLDTTVASVNSALQRARATLGRDDVVPTTDVASLDAEHRALLDRYEDAFLRYDIEALVALLHEDATLTMPPFPFWLQGAQEAGRFWLSPEPAKCRDSRLTPVEVNGQPGYAQYKPSRRRHPPRGLVPPGRAGRGWRGRAHRLLPRHPDGVPAVRPAPGVARGLRRLPDRFGRTGARTRVPVVDCDEPRWPGRVQRRENQ